MDHQYFEESLMKPSIKVSLAYQLVLIMLLNSICDKVNILWH